jgi:hypothetical protein
MDVFAGHDRLKVDRFIVELETRCSNPQSVDYDNFVEALLKEMEKKISNRLRPIIKGVITQINDLVKKNKPNGN